MTATDVTNSHLPKLVTSTGFIESDYQAFLACEAASSVGVRTEKSATVLYRRDGVIGLKDLIAIDQLTLFGRIQSSDLQPK